MTTAERNRRCLERARDALRSGVRVTYDPTLPGYLVPSKSHPGESHAVRVYSSRHGHVLFHCPCRAAEARVGVAGETPCTHAALAALEAAAIDLLAYDCQRWVLTGMGQQTLNLALTG